MALDAQQRFHLRKFIHELEKYRGRHTELVTVYVPAEYDLVKVIGQLSQEAGTATNIKSTSTRKNVIDALEKMIVHLRQMGRTPSHGVAAFAGNVAEKEGQSDVKAWSIEPPVPLKIRIYRCDKEFVLDPLRDMMESKEMYALVVMDRREGDVALLKGKSLIPIASTKSNVPGKSKAGGQSAGRFMRIREDAAKEFYGRVGRMMQDELFEIREQIKGILVGGPGPTKYDFVDGDFITEDLKKKIVAIKDIGYTGNDGLQELLDKSQDVLAEEELAAEKKIMLQFFSLLATRPNIVNYGEASVRKNLEMGMVETLLLSEALEEEKISDMEEIATQFNTNVRIISTETREGAQLRDFGKIAAILRYEVRE
ncbi:peptide chain release factor aRF-1 [Candidatus Woesearchaeota archaeon]|nr:peptide chain release factor aRF-1 [Candidatus Woesearchaeota archaeon]